LLAFTQRGKRNCIFATHTLAKVFAKMPSALLLKRRLASDGYSCARCATCLLLGANIQTKNKQWYKIGTNLI